MGRSKLPRRVDSVIKTKMASPLESSKIRDFMTISCDEIEALRLCDLIGLYQSEAAKKMEVSRATFARILFEARKKSAYALINGIPLHILKGNVRFEKENINCPIHKTKKRKGRICLCDEKKVRQNAH